MAERAFVIQQIGAKGSPERQRANEIYEYIIVPAVKAVGLEPYRADLDLSPGAITPRMLSELLDARVVIADLTGRNPNVFYELGVTHSFVRPLISIADSASTLPFDAKDERVIELGEYPASGLPMARGLHATASLQKSLEIVLAEGYRPPSPLGEAAANRSLDQLAPENPLAAEMAQMRETLEDVRRTVTQSGDTHLIMEFLKDIRREVPPYGEIDEMRGALEDIRRGGMSSSEISQILGILGDIRSRVMLYPPTPSQSGYIDALRNVINRHRADLTRDDLSQLASAATTNEQAAWAESLMGTLASYGGDAPNEPPA